MFMKYNVLRFADVEWKLVDIKSFLYFTKSVINIRREYVFVKVVTVQSNIKNLNELNKLVSSAYNVAWKFSLASWISFI